MRERPCYCVVSADDGLVLSCVRDERKPYGAFPDADDIGVLGVSARWPELRLDGTAKRPSRHASARTGVENAGVPRHNLARAAREHDDAVSVARIEHFRDCARQLSGKAPRLAVQARVDVVSLCEHAICPARVIAHRDRIVPIKNLVGV